ncbi:hypothetical protein [Paraflavitalea speifideaquila]|uniref:hypothetical protein n=1 Tax=Paraflavitalea speifideaquila TaxID=3076558 RepID=UPI0028EFF738|nr:hypothetical protein [Paraflavitalea speifideiaquila]
MNFLTPLDEPAYFKKVGESVITDKDYLAKIHNTQPVAVSLPKSFSNVIDGASAGNSLVTKAQRSGIAIGSAEAG